MAQPRRIPVWGGSSARATQRAVARARAEIGTPTEPVVIDVKVDRHAMAQLEAAQAKRARRASRA